MTLPCDWQDTVTRVIESSRVWDDNLICKNCGKPYGDHSFYGSFCPSRWPHQMNDSKFQALEGPSCGE